MTRKWIGVGYGQEVAAWLSNLYWYRNAYCALSFVAIGSSGARRVQDESLPTIVKDHVPALPLRAPLTLSLNDCTTSSVDLRLFRAFNLGEQLFQRSSASMNEELGHTRQKMNLHKLAGHLSVSMTGFCEKITYFELCKYIHPCR